MTEAVATEEETLYEFDEEFQSRIVYLALMDMSFLRKVVHLLKPEYFAKIGNRELIKLAVKHHDKFKSAMADVLTLREVIREAATAGVLRKDALAEVKVAFGEITAQKAAEQAGEVLGLNADYVAERVALFARNQAMTAAVYKSVDLIPKDEMDKVFNLVSEASRVGIEQDEEGGDYFEEIEKRSALRADQLVGKLPPKGITTGSPQLDNVLYHRGWGRRELSVLMGGAKAGKTTALIHFSSSAVLAGYNVLYVTLEVSREIIAQRTDARMSQTSMDDLVKNFAAINDRVVELRQKTGRFYLAEYPTGTLTPEMLNSLLERHKAKGWTYDMVVVDYADLVRPDRHSQDPIENSKSVYVDLRALASVWNVALLTATQSNRAGGQAIVAKMEHVSDDYNKIRIADIVISINSTEEERRDGKARLYFAASRNQRSGFTVFISQDFGKMTFLKAIEKIE